MKTSPPLETPDGRYIVVRGRLWRKSNPRLPPERLTSLVSELMSARRAVRQAGADDGRLRHARDAVNAAKIALGERGPVWWSDGAPDFNRHVVTSTPYADWYHARSAGDAANDTDSDAG